MIIFSTLFMTGCWDMIEIEDRIFPYSVGLDLNSSESEKFIITFSHPNVAAIGKNAMSDDRIHVVSETGNSIFEAEHKLTTKLQQPIYLKLLKVLILPEDVAKEEKFVREIVDGLNRDFIVNKNIQMLVVKDRAQGLLQAALKSKKQEKIGGALNALLLNKQNSTLFTPITCTNFIEHIDISNAAIVPIATVEGEYISIKGGAVFKDYKLIGYIDPMENRAIAYLNNEVRQDGIDVEYKGANLSLMITNSKTKKRLVGKENNIRIRYDVELEGHIHGFILDKKKSIETEEMLEEMQDTAARHIKQDADKVIEKLQKEFGADAIFCIRSFKKVSPKAVEGNSE